MVYVGLFEPRQRKYLELLSLEVLELENWDIKQIFINQSYVIQKKLLLIILFYSWDKNKFRYLSQPQFYLEPVSIFPYRLLSDLIKKS